MTLTGEDGILDLLNVADKIRFGLRLGESHYREFKTALEGLPGQKRPRSAKAIATDVAEALVAFANADGGEILIGVEDDCQVTGVPAALLEPTPRALIETAPERLVLAQTPLAGVQKQVVELDGKSLYYFRVRKSTSKIHQLADGRCLRRQDLESAPVAAELLEFSRKESASREYDREFVDEVRLIDLDLKLIERVSQEFAYRMSPERFLQQYDLADFATDVLRLRRAAVLLFGTEKAVARVHPRMEIRILEVDGLTVGTGERFNVRRDTHINGNIFKLLEDGWSELRPFLAFIRYTEGARFQQTVLYPESACREALVNAIAHRDYSQLGRGIEVYVFRDRLEYRSPGELLSTVRLDDLQNARGVHESRNTYIARILRETGYMRELGEGVRRMIQVMKDGELVPPVFISESDVFSTVFSQRTHYSEDEQRWLANFSELKLDREQRAIIAMGINGELIAPQRIFDQLGIVDTEHYRQLVSSLQEIGILLSIKTSSIAKRRGMPARNIPRYRVVLPSEAKPAGPVHRRKDVAKGVDLDEQRLYLGNIPSDTELAEIQQALQELGITNLADAHLPQGRAGRGKGFAFVTLPTLEDRKHLITAANSGRFRIRQRIVEVEPARFSSGRRP